MGQEEGSTVTFSRYGTVGLLGKSWSARHLRRLSLLHSVKSCPPRPRQFLADFKLSTVLTPSDLLWSFYYSITLLPSKL